VTRQAQCIEASQQFDAQSVSVWHIWPLAHWVQVPPPQSTSVSAPSRRWSAHWLSTQVLIVGSQAPEMQSVLAAHIAPLSHWVQVPPPQSTSVSVPSLVPSPQESGWHVGGVP
jgi:hypothetical protein